MTTTTPAPDAPAAKPAKARRPRPAEWRFRLRRFSALGLVSTTLAIAVVATVLYTSIPSRIQQAPAPELLEIADTALAQGEYARAYPWLRAAFDRPVTHAETDRPALLNPEQPVTRAELAAGYEGFAARDILIGQPKAQDFLGLVVRALAESPERGERFVELLRDPDVAPVLQRALSHQLLEPSLRAIARTAAGLEPADKQRLARGAARLRSDGGGGAERFATVSDGPVSLAEVDRRIEAVFAFVRDSVAVLPERELAERGMRYPADTLYQGAGRPSEVNWLLVELLQALFERGKAWGLELKLAPNPLVPLDPIVSPEIPPFIHNIDRAGAIPDLGTPTHHGGSTLAILLVESDAGWRLYAFDVYAGVALIQRDGALLDLFAFFAGEAAPHPLLVEHLSYLRYRERISAGQLRLVANPIRATWMGARLNQLGLDVGPFPGPSPLTLALEDRLRDDDGRWLPLGVDMFGPPPHEQDTRVELAQAIATARERGEIAEPRHSRDVAGFPYLWRWQQASRWWIVEALQAELEGPRIHNDAVPDAIQRRAQQDNLQHRLRALDYRRPSDATSRHEVHAYSVFHLETLRDNFLFPPDPSQTGREPTFHTGILVGTTITGAPLLLPAEAMRRLVPPRREWTAAAVRRTQARIGVALGYYWVGEWEMAALTFDDYDLAIRTERTSTRTDRYPGKWHYLASFTRGRALWRLGRFEAAQDSWERIPDGAPLGVAARLAHELPRPQPYFDDFAETRPWE